MIIYLQSIQLVCRLVCLKCVFFVFLIAFVSFHKIIIIICHRVHSCRMTIVWDGPLLIKRFVIQVLPCGRLDIFLIPCRNSRMSGFYPSRLSVEIQELILFPLFIYLSTVVPATLQSLHPLKYTALTNGNSRTYHNPRQNISHRLPPRHRRRSPSPQTHVA